MHFISLCTENEGLNARSGAYRTRQDGLLASIVLNSFDVSTKVKCQTWAGDNTWQWKSRLEEHVSSWPEESGEWGKWKSYREVEG